MKWREGGVTVPEEMRGVGTHYTPTFFFSSIFIWASKVAQWERTSLPMQETLEMQVLSLDQEDPLEEEVATHSSILAWKIPWTEEPGRL